MIRFWLSCFCCLGLLSVGACRLAPSPPPPENEAPLVLQPARFSALPGWQADDQRAVLSAFGRSCARIMKRPAQTPFGADPRTGTYGDWQSLCAARPADNADNQTIRQFFESRFIPYRATAGGESDTGLFTGYYEPALRGAPTRSGPYQTPLYKRPADLVMVDLGAFRDELKGQRIAGRVVDARLKPYEDRAAITAGKWPHNNDDQVLVWVDDPIGAFFLQIQGSGRINMADGTVLRVGYDGQNGHPYYAIGRELVKRGALDKDAVSLQSIRDWLGAHPDQAVALMNTNASYVFFKTLENEDGPLGGEGIPLTPGRSLAIDHSRLPYGVPIWVDLAPPTAQDRPLQRLMMAQDTGGAIRGAVRGDVFWGAGPQAEYRAGHMKSEGRMWVLLPRLKL